MTNQSRLGLVPDIRDEATLWGHKRESRVGDWRRQADGSGFGPMDRLSLDHRDCPVIFQDGYANIGDICAPVIAEGLQKFCLRYSLPLQFCSAAMAMPDEDLGCSFDGALKPLAAERQNADAIRKNDKGCSRYETADEGRVVSNKRILNRLA